MANGLIRHTLFKELKDGDFIYYINPFIAVNERTLPMNLLIQPTIGAQDQFIQAVKIKEIKGMPDSLEYKGWIEIEYFRPEIIFHAPDIEKIPTAKLRVDGGLNIAVTLVMLEGYPTPAPVPYCTDKDFLIAWIKSTR